MATSRTGTARWLRVRARVVRRDRAAGVRACPLCGVLLDYDASGMPNSVEVDHIVPHASGGRDELDNLRTVCRRCNRSRGGVEGARRTWLARGRAKALKNMNVDHSESW